MMKLSTRDVVAIALLMALIIKLDSLDGIGTAISRPLAFILTVILVVNHVVLMVGDMLQQEEE